MAVFNYKVLQVERKERGEELEGEKNGNGNG